jgi:peptidyl-prolyl cis-trans isomerase C
MAIQVNGVDITETAVAAELQYHPAPSLDAARDAASRALVIRELLLQEAARLGVVAEPGDDPEEGGEEALVRTLLARAVTVPDADEATCRRFYEANRRRFCSPDMYEGAHILFPAAREDAPAREAARSKAQEALRDILANPASFAARARELSACPSAANGGALGQLTRGDTVPEFETFLFNLDEGQICPVPVETRYGVHLMRLDRKIAGRPLPFDAVRERIAAYLQEHAWRRGVSQYLQILAGRAEIAGIAIAGAETPLVQ